MDTDPAARTPISNGHDYWTFLTNHGAVLQHVSEYSDDTIVQIADLLGLRERAVAAIVSDLRRLGYLDIERQGRHNHYSVNEGMPLRRPAHAHLSVQSLLSGIKGQGDLIQAPHAARAESQRLHSFFGT